MTDRVPIGRVGKPHGLDGSFYVERPSTDDRWWKVGSRFLSGGQEEEIIGARRAQGRPVIKLDRSVDTKKYWYSRQAHWRCPSCGARRFHVIELRESEPSS